MMFRPPVRATHTCRVDDRVRLAVRVTGVVQGVGFGPFVHALAVRLGLSGQVGNDSAGVFIEVEGDRRAVKEFLAAVRDQAPPLATVDEVSTRELEPGARPGSGSSRVHPEATPARWSRRTARPAPTACANCSTRPTGATATRTTSRSTRTARRHEPAARPETPCGQALRRDGARSRHGPNAVRGRRAGATAAHRACAPHRADAEPASPRAVGPASRRLGLLLPYTPLHHLLPDSFGGPLVLTSANVSDEPIAYRDDDARRLLSGIADAFLAHDREIHVRTDDSVVLPFRGRTQVQRRSRGYAPEPIVLGEKFARHVLACGAESKNTFCLAKDGHAVLSQHVGDLGNFETLRCFAEGVEHFARLFDIKPDVVAHDLHPEYLSTKYALGLAGVELVGVQHHHAHIASCLADNGEDGPVLGVAFDGTGYGLDGTIWGGEFVLADLAGFERLAHLVPVPMPGGVAAIRQTPARLDRRRHRRALRRGVPERPPAGAHRGCLGGQAVPGAHALSGARGRRRCQPRPGRGRQP